MGVGGVRRVEVTERESPAFGGTEFGAIGSYERLKGAEFGVAQLERVEHDTPPPDSRFGLFNIGPDFPQR